MKKNYKIIFFSALAIIVLVVIYITINSPVKVDTITASYRDFLDIIEQSGTVTSVESLDISSPIGGKVLYTVEENSVVGQGDLLLEVDSEEFEIKIKQLQAQKDSNLAQKDINTPSVYSSQVKQMEVAIDQTQLEIKNAQENYEDAKILHENGAISQKDLEDISFKLDSLNNKLISDKEQLNLLYESSAAKKGINELYISNNKALDENINLLKKKISESKIYASFDGVVTKNMAKIGQIIQPMAPIISISGYENLQIESYMLTDDAVSIKVGDEVKITQKTSSKDLEGVGKVREIDDFAVDRASSLGINEKRVKITVDIVDYGELDIKSNYEVDLGVVLDEKKDVIFVPKTAIFKNGDKDSLFVVENGRAVIREVTTGRHNDKDIIIKSGVEEKDAIITVSDVAGLEENKRVKSN